MLLVTLALYDVCSFLSVLPILHLFLEMPSQKEQWNPTKVKYMSIYSSCQPN